MTNKTAFLRDYQKDIVARVKEAWELHRSVMVQMPTGTGKTHVLASIVADFPGKVLIVAHRVELVEQIRETILKLKIENEKLKNTDVNSHKSEIINQKLSYDCAKEERDLEHYFEGDYCCGIGHCRCDWRSCLSVNLKP